MEEMTVDGLMDLVLQYGRACYEGPVETGSRVAQLAAIRSYAASLAVPQEVTDAQRIDFLEQMANRRGGILLHDGSERGRTGLGLRPGAVNRTLREAIDAAMPDPA